VSRPNASNSAPTLTIKSINRRNLTKMPDFRRTRNAKARVKPSSSDASPFAMGGELALGTFAGRVKLLKCGNLLSGVQAEVGRSMRSCRVNFYRPTPTVGGHSVRISKVFCRTMTSFVVPVVTMYAVELCAAAAAGHKTTQRRRRPPVRRRTALVCRQIGFVSNRDNVARAVLQ